MNYEIIGAIDILRDWVKELPDLSEDERFYLTTLARKKYQADLPTSLQSFGRFLVKKERIIQTIAECQVELDLYKAKGVTVKNGLVVYMHPNPRDLRKATLKSFAVLGQRLSTNTPFNPINDLHTVAQKTPGNKKWVSFDFDEADVGKQDTLKSRIRAITDDSTTFIVTSGGFHALVESSKCPKSQWYTEIVKLGPDVKGDMLSPIPGTWQGSHLVDFER